ncbi:MAG: DUF1559 domain-containing protein [Planctomycetaceae bacterium]
MNPLTHWPRRTSCDRHRSLRRLWMLLALSVAACLPGCGNSQEDIMMRAARRTRPKDPDPTPPAVKAVQPPPAAAAASATMNASAAPAAVAVTPTADTRLTEKAEPTQPAPSLSSLKPIADRKPAEPMPDIDRRKRALHNLEKVAKALNKYSRERGTYPPATLKSSGGIPMLSWRVAILPELGYEELYRQFNLQEPWDSEHNQQLLVLIPEEYVSPERFDTATNIQLPVAGGYLFDGKKSPRADSIEDGAENTILLLEVDDSNAVPWTKPADFSSRFKNVKTGIGNLRGDGTFAVWATGWPTLLSNQLSWEQLHNALTWESGDGQMAAAVHRPITIDEVSEASIAKDTPEDLPSTPAVETPTLVEPPMVVREAVPLQSALAAAGKRLREVYANRLRDAKNDEDLTELAKEMLDQSEAMTEDPTSAFALQIAAAKLASTAGDIETVLRAVDMRVARFDVDAYEENVSALTTFGIENVHREPKKIEGMAYLRRALTAIFSAVQVDDFDSAGSIIHHAYKLIDQPRDEPIPKSLSTLRTQLSTCRRQFESAKQALATYRVNPSDGEAAATFGRYLCFIKGDWKTGLPLLCQGGSEALRSVAVRDHRGAQTMTDQMELGDVWWELAETSRSGLYRQAARDRAAFWYRQAVASMPESLDKLHVQGRLDEAGSADKSSPLALLQSIAAQTDVDLMVSLASISDGQTRQRQTSGEPN